MWGVSYALLALCSWVLFVLWDQDSQATSGGDGRNWAVPLAGGLLWPLAWLCIGLCEFVTWYLGD